LVAWVTLSCGLSARPTRRGILNMSHRLSLCCLALVWLAGAGGWRGKRPPPRPSAPGGGGRRPGNAQSGTGARGANPGPGEDPGKPQVKSVELTKQSDGTYSGVVKTPGGDTIRVSNVTVRENAISWDETIDQTGTGANHPRAAPDTPKNSPPLARPATDIKISSRSKADWAPGKYKVGDYVEYAGPDGQFSWSEEIQEVGDHFYVYLRTVAVDGRREQYTFRAKFERDPSPAYGATTKRGPSRQMAAGGKNVRAE